MEITGSQNTVRTLEKPTVDRLGKVDSVENKKLRLKKATKEFESFFVLHMLKAMRATIPESDLLEGGLGKDIYTSMFDQELSQRIAGSSSQSLGEVLYRTLEKHIDGEAGILPDGPPTKLDTRITEEMRSTDRSPYRPEKAVETPQTEILRPPDTTGQFQSARPKMSDDPVLARFGQTIEKSARRYKVDPKLVYAVIMVESEGRPDAVSPKGAKGLMQLTDSTAADMGVADSLNPDQNIDGGTKYLSRLLEKYDGDLKLTLAAYNSGPGNVSKYNGVPPFNETRRYIEKVLDRLYNQNQASAIKTLG